MSASSESENDSTQEVWEDSETPAEDWGDDEKTDWPVEGIVGEEVNTRGELLYEIAWADWERTNGSNTTWGDLSDRTDLVNAWTKIQNARRAAVVAEGLNVEVRNYLDFHNAATDARAQAVAEKTRARKREPERYDRWDLEVEKHLQHLEGNNTDGETTSRRDTLRVRSADTRSMSQSRASSSSLRSLETDNSEFAPQSSRSATITSIASSHTASSSASALGHVSTPSHIFAKPQPQLDTSGPSHIQFLEYYPPIPPKPLSSESHPSPKKKSKSRPRIPSSSPLPSSVQIKSPTKVHAHAQPALLRQTRPLPSRSSTSSIIAPALPRRRAELQSSWSAAAKKAAAAAVFIMNDVDEEEVPPLPKNFQYRESKYKYPRHIRKPGAEFLVMCGCKEEGRTCNMEGGGCECQTSVEGDAFPYAEGLYTFAHEGEVVECHEGCSCPPECQNRVAQRSRNFPVEVFKTVGCGWGARATVAIERGKVLGLYTGKIIRRKDVKDALPEAEGYLFDLDAHELGGGDGDADDDDEHPRYSVDSYEYGNWTRFINHSCEPNICIYPVTYDTPSQPYHAFVATKDLPAHTEFTLNYRAASRAVNKGKGRTKRPEGAEDCRCGSNSCLGWR